MHNLTPLTIADPCNTCPRERAVDTTHHQDHQAVDGMARYESHLMVVTTVVRTRSQNHTPEGIMNNEGHLETQM